RLSNETRTLPGHRNLISRGEPTARCRWNTQRLKCAVADVDRTHAFGFGDACDIRRAGSPYAERLEGPILFGVGEIHRGRKKQAVGEACQPWSAGSYLPERHQLVRLWIPQRPN